MYHEYSIEKLVHYRCGACERWWSIGDGPQLGILACPWCGWMEQTKPIDTDEEEHHG